MSGKGKRYELSLKNEINDVTDHTVHCVRPDYSGSSKGSVSDLLVLRDGCTPVALEIKKRSGDSGKRVTVMSGSKKGTSGLDELEDFVHGAPTFGHKLLAVKFDHREISLIKAGTLSYELKNEDTSVHDARLTPSDNISMVKPTLDHWPSSTSGMSDVDKIVNAVMDLS